MWIPFFNSKKKCGRASRLDIHHEVTQRISSRPDIHLLQRGLMLCSSCGSEIALLGHTPLSMGHCPICGKPNYFPMRIKGYWLYEPIGGGGMGSVYHAFDASHPETDLAIKILPRKQRHDQVLAEALMEEALIGSKMSGHPHIVKVLDMGYADGEYFSAMEYVDGIRLDRIIESPVNRPAKQIILWMLQILSAEQHIFENGYLFRDLKPQNIIIDNSGNVKLFDFGLALTVEDALKEGSSPDIQGSPFYIPPERVVGAAESLCSEIYSLGMVLFHVIARQTYYSAEEIAGIFRKHVNSLRLNKVDSKLPHETDPELVKILNKMICRTPAQRYQTYKELAMDLMKIYKKSA